MSYFSGGKIENFKRGWGVDITTFGKSHYYTLNNYGNAIAKCGRWTEVEHVYAEGTFPRCKSCKHIVGAA